MPYNYLRIFQAQITTSVILKKVFACYENPLTISTYFGTISMFLVGYGDVVAIITSDCVIVSCLEIVGTFIICYTTAQLCASYALHNYFLKQYQENVFSLKR